MTPMILDMAALFGFKPWGGNIDALGDSELENRRVKVPMKASKTEILCLKTYSGFMISFQGMADREQEHMMFLLFWLNRFIFPNVDGSVSPEYMQFESCGFLKWCRKQDHRCNLRVGELESLKSVTQKLNL
ncbi:hypothetical protein CerSpe_019520 [Prunus speciosa]